MIPRVLHVITGLRAAGAETMLFKLLRENISEAAVVSMTETGPVGEQIQGLGIEVHALGLRRGVPDPRGVVALRRIIRGYQPDLVQTWLYHADLLGGLAARLERRPVIWNVRQSTLDAVTSKWATRLAYRLGARLSHHLPQWVVCCSHAGLELHVRRGYDAARMVLIPNGFDLELLKPDRAASAALRVELSVAPATPLIGLVARWDPQKDHRTFVAAAAALTASPPPHFVLCGEGVTPGNAQLAAWIAAPGLSERFHLLGRRDDIPALMAGLDVLTSASYQEGFSNVIGEAMACGVPCVVTDAGDSARIVGDTGYVVPPRDAAAIAAAWESLLGQSPAAREELGLRARQRIAGEYSIGRIARMYADLYGTVARSSARAAAAPGQSTLPAAS